MTEPRAFHPLADLFPLMEGEEFDALVTDIKAHGLHESITLFEGMVLDGRNRARVCAAAKVEPRYSPFQGDENAARAYVISKNIHRRHLTQEQRRELLVKLVAAQPEKSDRAIAKEVGTAHTTVARARKQAEATGAVAPVDKRRGADGKKRKQPTKKAKNPPPAPSTSAEQPPPNPSSSAAVSGAPGSAPVPPPPAAASGTKSLEEQIAEDRKRIRAKAKQDRDEALWIGAVLRNEKRRFAVLDALAGALRNTASNTTSSATANTENSAAGNTEDTATANTEDAATAKTESSGMGNDADPAESAEARKAHYVAGEDDEQQTGREDEEDEEDESEEEQPRRRPKLQEIKTTLDEALNDAFAELSELAGECRDLVDNAPPGIDQTQRIQTFDETASQLEEITDPPTVAPELADLPITYSVPRTRHSSRATRCWDACAAINACVEALDSVAESDPRRQEASELASELQETVGSAENCEFPGMFG
jgi:hypothetical protein